jgi:hypothetical protein
MSNALPNPSRSGVGQAGLTILLLLALGAALVAASPSRNTGLQEPTQRAADVLGKLNNASRMLYAQAKAAALAKAGPVMILVGDDLVMRIDGKRQQARVIPESYHALKAFAHLPMAIDVALSAYADENPLAEDAVNELREYRSMFPAAGSAIAAAGLDGEQCERQKAMVEACAKFLDSVIESRRCTAQQRIAFARKMNPLIMANSSAAARAALDSLHRRVSEWRSQLTPEEWKRLTVIVTGRALPRKDNLAIQYFARLLGLPGEGERLIYAESIADESGALDLMATHRVGSGIAIDFFNDPDRMDRDLLGDSVRDYLPLLIDHSEGRSNQP